jgi:hypothetical protein
MPAHVPVQPRRRRAVRQHRPPGARLHAAACRRRTAPTRNPARSAISTSAARAPR